MAKVLISPIGTGAKVSDRNYSPAKYKFVDNDNIYNTSFVSAALAEHLKVDKIIFIGTARSMWEEVYRYFMESAGMELDEEYWIKVGDLSNNSRYNNKLISEDALKKVMFSVDKYLKSISTSATGGSNALIIDYGINEDELWNNFDIFMKLVELLNNNDEIYLDITHSFRSIPLFMYLMMEFIHILNNKKIFLKGIYYGMLEVKNEIEYAPIVDLKPLFEISQWIRGAHEFINYGNGYLISRLIEDDNSNSEEISKRINNISDLVNINYITDLQQQITNLNKLLKSDCEYGNVFKYLSPIIKDFLLRFNNIEKASELQLELSKWCFENKKYTNGYICLVESVLTKLCEVYGLEISDIANRDLVKRMLANRANQRKVPTLKKLADKYFAINDIRKRIAHASFYQSDRYSFRTDIDQAVRNFEDIKKILDSEDLNNINQIINLTSPSSAN